jgi:ABC-2 type transport system permease protein
MLWYKAWHESKTRFFYSLIGMFLISGLFVLSFQSLNPDPTRMNFQGFVWQALYFRFFHAAWVFSTLFLTLGGLLSERNRGTALFTLSLPVSRRRMLLVRTAVGAAEASATAILPAISISAFALLAHQTYSPLQSFEFALLLMAGGTAFFGLGILFATVLRGDAAPLAIGIPFIAGIYTATRSIEALRSLNPQDLFSGAATVHPPTWSLGTPLPWAAIFISIGIALVSLIASVLITERLEV